MSKAKRAFPWIAPKLRPLAVPIESLKADPKNTRTHDEANLKAIEASLLKFGQVSPIVVNSRNNQVVVGNGRLIAATRLGWTHIAVVRKTLTPAEQRALSIADNRTAELADWDMERLESELASFEEEDSELFGDLLLAELTGAVATDDEAEEVDVPESWQVVVVCSSETEQKALYERLKTEGLECRLLIM